jgi:uncharacterized repeat protein (TIGR03803 family)
MNWNPANAAPAILLRRLFLTFMFLFLTLAAQSARAQTFTVIHTFTGPDGSYPQTGVTIDAAGNLYGTTVGGGATGNGTVFELSNPGSGWVLNTLYSFSWLSSGGSDPQGRITVAQDGSLYGTAQYGGIGQCFEGYGCGVVFRLEAASPGESWTETVVHSFSGKSDGGNPQGDLTFDAAGDIYGIAGGGGSPGGDCIWPSPYSCGTAYKLTPSSNGWLISVLHYFQMEIAGYWGTDGSSPRGGLVLDNAGNVYGTTLQGGRHGDGTIYQLSPHGSRWTEQILNNSDGVPSNDGLIMDASGNIYGTTLYGGDNDAGTVFELSLVNGTWTYNTIFAAFPSDGGNCTDLGCGPQGRLLMDAAGNLYGTTIGGGAYGYGNVFKLTRSSGGWTYTSLHDFTGRDDGGGAYPFGGVVRDANGNLYGTTDEGGTNDQGVVFEITP